MTLLIPSCERVIALLTDYEEGSLGPFDWLGMKLHLALCPPCQGFLVTFERTPALLRRAWDDGPTPGAEHALSGALCALREGRAPRGPQHHPEPEAWGALGPGGDPLLALLLRVHLGYCEDCRGAHGEAEAILPGDDPMAALRPHLPPETHWVWTRRGLGGGQIARLRNDPRRGAVLSLAKLKGGRCVPRHDHVGPEASVLLCGGLQDGPAHLTPGDWITHAPGHRHGPEADPGGDCLALIHLEAGIRFEGWRGLFGTVR
jgi:putative transcriptional regulator